MDGAPGLELRDYLRVIRRRLTTIFVVTAVAVFVTGLLSFLVIRPTYQSQATLIVVDKSAPIVDYNSFTLAEQLVQTYATLGTSQTILSGTISRYNLPFTVLTLSQGLTVTPVTNTNLVTVAAKDSTPSGAAAIANDIAYVLARRAQAITPGYDVKVVDPAVPATVPSSPNKKLNMALALVLGLFVGTGLAFLQDYLDRTIHDADHLASEIGLPILGAIPMIDAKAVDITKARGDITRNARARA